MRSRKVLGKYHQGSKWGNSGGTEGRNFFGSLAVRVRALPRSHARSPRALATVRLAVDRCARVAHRGRSELPRGPVDGKRSRTGSPRASTGPRGGEGCHGRPGRNVQQWAWPSTRGRGWVYDARRVSCACGSTAKARAPGGCPLGPNLSVIHSFNSERVCIHRRPGVGCVTEATAEGSCRRASGV